MIKASRAIRYCCLRGPAGLIGALGLAALAASADAADVGVSVSIGQPGFYGQIDIGDVPQPPKLILGAPVVVERDPHYEGPAMYLHVPAGYEKHWDRHCREYNACGRPVYFVRDDWYRDTYVPHYQHRKQMRAEEQARARPEDERHGGERDDRRGGEREHHE
jgi:hypothetical protein